ncbi:DinB family protein [Spelaeicoccus albus]|uniref:DinB-like domain-containing protein n=1 Tax=Spelaeicoccus albus TaxID=1280376 RepID=A0A7Z0A8S6_9MICO|nr:DinB family protein [Spelaeicoccus albus]NYI66484.1 hypothetical protein [Spelaeicoccus albus]
MDTCAECGFDYADVASVDVADAIVAETAEFASRLESAGDHARGRREAGIWSPLEYGCHLRDMLLVQRERVLAARRRDTPTFDPMGRDERVEHDGYALQNPDGVAAQLRMASALLADDLRLLGDSDWNRLVMYNYPQRTERTLRWVAVHTLHEVRHHRMDIDRQLS